MNGPNQDAKFWGGQGGSLRYDLGTVVVCKLAEPGPLPSEWKRKSNLQAAFGDYGHILRFEIPSDKGLVYIEYDDKRDAMDVAKEMSGKMVCGKKVIVEIAQAASSSKSSNLHDKVYNIAHTYRLDESASAQLLKALAERSRLTTCDIDHDLQELSEHLAASNKPSALVCNKLGDIRSGKALGPCTFAARKRESEHHAPPRDRSRSHRKRDSSNSRRRRDRSSYARRRSRS